MMAWGTPTYTQSRSHLYRYTKVYVEGTLNGDTAISVDLDPEQLPLSPHKGSVQVYCENANAPDVTTVTIRTSLSILGSLGEAAFFQRSNHAARSDPDSMLLSTLFGNMHPSGQDNYLSPWPVLPTSEMRLFAVSDNAANTDEVVKVTIGMLSYTFELGDRTA